MKIRRYSRSPKPNSDFSYNGISGDWWHHRAADRAHQRAYRNIADFIGASLPGSPRLLADYACGAGDLLSLLCRHFSKTHCIGLDGSNFLLNLAEKRLSTLPNDCVRRISLIETELPMRSSLRERADLVVFCFPNMTPASEEENHPVLSAHANDIKIAQYLAEAQEPDEESPPFPDPAAIRHTLLYGRSISHNLRRLLVRGGTCIRVEYATSRRHEWTPLSFLQVSFEEGSLDTEVAGITPRPWFRVLASAYFRSKVLEDVYQQTDNERDKNGGYLITVLRGV
jgi:hypothetical protein